MPALDRLSPADVVRTIEAFRDALRLNQEAINRLNVYPVPDGDTGTNLALTLESTVTTVNELPSADKNDMAAVCKAIAAGSLMGARGNSGVIMCQILRGVVAECRGGTTVGALELAAGLVAASTAAYGAVGRPVEGTILTVVREASEAAEGAARTGVALLELLDTAKTAAAAALARTPELLPVLKQAGVVDAGGAGLCLLLDAALHVVDGRPLPVLDTAGPSTTVVNGGVRMPPSGEQKALADLRYEVMYLLEAADESVPGFKDVWGGIGDSIVVVGGDGLWNCHIHTDDIGAAIEAAIDIGRPRNIRVTDLLEEVEEERWVREASAAGLIEEDPPHVSEPCATAVVAVATGDGIRRLFLSLGAQRIVTGGQSMNPSTQQLLDAVEACPAESVVILPNNKNIIAVAEQVQELTAKLVRVVPTKGITEGLAAAMQYDPQGDIEENAATMGLAAQSIIGGELTRAVRDSSCDTGPIHEGDYLGIMRDGGIVSVAGSLAEAATGLLAKMVTDDHEIVTIIEGDGSHAADTRRITEWLADNRPGAAAEVHHGGQPLYPYLFGAE